jgi:hypothetical protein
MNPDNPYSPDAIRFWLGGAKCPRCRWAMLESAREGATGCTGMGSGRGDRLALILLKADLERAADSLPTHWQSTELIFRRQHRYSALVARRTQHMALGATESMNPSESTHSATLGRIREHESPIPSKALEDAIWRMAVFLGWQEGQAA